MRYSGIIFNDFTAAPGVSVTFFTQGCPHQCPGCHNPETWDFDGGKEFTPNLIDEICVKLKANGITRNFCLMGGEPLCQQNIFLSYLLIQQVKERVPEAKIYVYTGYTYEQLLKSNDKRTMMLLDSTDVLVDGPYIDSLRDITLPMRGSSNQRIIDLTNLRKNDII